MLRRMYQEESKWKVDILRRLFENMNLGFRQNLQNCRRKNAERIGGGVLKTLWIEEECKKFITLQRMYHKKSKQGNIFLRK